MGICPFKMFLHEVNLHSLTLAQMCGCTQVRSATLQAIAECSTHTHRQPAWIKLEEGRGAQCVNTSVNVVLLTVSSAMALSVSANWIYLDLNWNDKDQRKYTKQRAQNGCFASHAGKISIIFWFSQNLNEVKCIWYRDGSQIAEL